MLWTARWLILASTLIAALVGLVLTFLTTTNYVAKARSSTSARRRQSAPRAPRPPTPPPPSALTGDRVDQVAEELGVPPSASGRA